MVYHGSDIRQPVVVDRVPKARLGALLNTVTQPAFPCPACDTNGPMGVYVRAVRWPCGHTRSLPPLARGNAAGRGNVIILRTHWTAA